MNIPSVAGRFVSYSSPTTTADIIAELNRYGADPLQPVALEHALSQAEGRPDLEVVGLSDLAAKDPHRTLTRVRSRGSMGEGWCEIISYNTRFALKLVRCCSF